MRSRRTRPARAPAARRARSAAASEWSLKSRSALYTIAVATAGGDECSAEFLANVGDMNIQQVRERAVVLIEQMLVQGCARHNFAAVQRQELQECVFAGC